MPGIKQQVADMLALIGREGIFSTYSIHDISHIDAMLSMLDWVIPDSTRAAMTPVDWLLTVLAIYLHDLGMVVTTQEYERRLENPDFTSWRESLDKTTDGREYLDRASRMSVDEQNRFFFQEFIRKGHAQRIREWVTGRHSRTWGPHVESIAGRVAELLKAVPSRFREYLAIACESHHRPDLEIVEKYPLAARLGNDPREIVNVQYAAILLRTTDLLHVTKDRTPSVMYQTIRFSDPKSVEEWDKQLGTFAVGPKGRKLDESNPESAVIIINADFTDERPLFSLQEYIAYADSEIRQSRRWAEKSRENADAKDYTFPWLRVEGDVRLEGVEPQPMRFELDRGRLLDLLVGHTIYNDPTVAIRELLQNGIDAVRYQAYIDRHAAGPQPRFGKVTVRWDREARMLVVEDDGTGMDRDIISHHLMSVGSSFYNTPQFEAEHKDFVPISRFGIGILTCFMVSDDIEIVTFRDGRGHRIRMTSVKSTYLLRELEIGDPLLSGLEPHGTRVTLRLRGTIDLSERTVLDIVRYWVILPECTVEYREAGQAPVSVGFKSLPEALRHYYSAEERGGPDLPKLEIVVKSRSESQSPPGQRQGVYELAFGVDVGFYPEHSFSLAVVRLTPRVCIEGIRVSNDLPGYGSPNQPHGLSALLAVRGARKFRTTVSRAGLEVDDEYEHVADLCMDMLVEHVRDEVARISSKPGRPLSQAASGSEFLTGQLTRSARWETLRRSGRLLDELPSTVVERVETAGGEPKTFRELVSDAQLREMPSFWTVESRSVDSLGLISRDLGRELSLNEFLLALAPEVTQLSYSPMLPDARNKGRSIRQSHRPDRVEFSRQHQQTAINWIKRDSPSDCQFDVGQIASEEFLDLLREALQAESRQFDRRYLLAIDLECGVFVGDNEKIEAVTTRVGVVLRQGGGLLATWRLLRGVAIELVEHRSLEDSICALGVANAFFRIFSERASRFAGDPRTAETMWRDQIPRFRDILSQLGRRWDPPADLRDLVATEKVFDATSFWRKWYDEDED
jgi:molecular chaperone HtpG